MLGEATGGSKRAHCVEEKAVNEVVKISGGHGGLNTAVSTAAQIRQLQEKWQAHAKAARLNRARCRQLRQQLVHDEPAAVEAELSEEAAEQQRSAQEDKRTEPAAGTEVHGQQRLPTPDPVRSTDATVSHQ